MKVLHVIASVDPRGGGPIAGVHSSSAVWIAHGHERNIVCLDAPEDSCVKASPVPTFAVGLSGTWYAWLRQRIPLLRYSYSPNLVKWLRTNVSKYDAVIINGLWNYASLGSWRALHRLNTPYFVFTHGMLDPWFNRAYPKKTIIKNLYWKLFEHKVLRDAHGVFFTCEEERQLAATSFSPYQAREFVVGYGAQDVTGDPQAQSAAFFRRLPTARGRKLILFLGRIHEKKGVDLLIDAFASLADEFSDFDLVIAGPDQRGLYRQLICRSAERGIAGRIHWPGMLSGDAKWGAFRSAAFFVLPSHQENFGIVVSEALALSKPVLVTNKVNIWREIQADGAGRVVNDDVKAIEKGLRDMCSLPEYEIAEIGRMARNSFATRFDLEANALQLLELIRRLTKEGDMPLN